MLKTVKRHNMLKTTSNLVIALISVLTMSFIVMPSASAVSNGATITNQIQQRVSAETPAEAAARAAAEAFGNAGNEHTETGTGGTLNNPTGPSNGGGNSAPRVLNPGYTHYQTLIVDLRTGSDPMPTGWRPPASTPRQVATARCTGQFDIGASVTYSTHLPPYYTDEGRGTVRITQTGYNCLQLTYSDNTEYCYVSATVVIDEVIPNNKRLANTTVNTSWGNGDQSYASCLSSHNVRAGLSIYLVDYGRYTAPFHINQQAITVRHYGVDEINGNTPAPEIRSIGGIGVTQSSNNYAQKTCAGTTISRNQAVAWTGNWTWTETDCGPGNSNGVPPTYQCNVGGVTINGQAVDNATIFRDGNDNSLTWSQPSITGTNLRSTGNPRTRVDRSGTPWNSVANRSNNDNDVKLYRNGISVFNQDNGTSWTDGLLTDYKLTASWASAASTPTVITPIYQWTGIWGRETTVITGVDFTTGTFTTSTVITDTEAAAICNGPIATLTVVRAVNSK